MRKNMRTTSRSRLPALIWATCAFAHILTFAVVNYVQPTSYMDEIFHVPQAQRFCKMDLSWDPMITTLPGMARSLRPFTEYFGQDCIAQPSNRIQASMSFRLRCWSLSPG
jgi:hypothetical protein